MRRFDVSAHNCIQYEDFADRLQRLMMEDTAKALDASLADLDTTLGMSLGGTSGTLGASSGRMGVDRAEETMLRVLARMMARGPGGMPAREALLTQFKEFDRDASDYISQRELGQALARLQVEVNEADILALMRRFNANHRGISYKDFTQHLFKLAAEKGLAAQEARLRATGLPRNKTTVADNAEAALFRRLVSAGLGQSKRAQLERMFREADTSGSGRVSPTELQRLLASLGVKLTSSELQVRTRDNQRSHHALPCPTARVLTSCPGAHRLSCVASTRTTTALSASTSLSSTWSS